MFCHVKQFKNIILTYKCKKEILVMNQVQPASYKVEYKEIKIISKMQNEGHT